MKHQKILLCAIAVTIFLWMQSAFAFTVEEKTFELSGNVITYPQIIPSAGEEATAEIVNKLITDAGAIPDRVSRASLLMTSENKIFSTWTGGILGDVFACRFFASGPLSSNRVTTELSGTVLDLLTGSQVTMTDLFIEPAAALEAVEEILDCEVAPEMSAHLRNCELIPVPDSFTVNRTGLTLLYPADRLMTLHDRAGDVTIGWNELAEYLDLTGESILSRIGVPDMLRLTPESAAALKRDAAEGCLPDIPAVLGRDMGEIVGTFGLLSDGDLYAAGRIAEPEGGVWRGVALTTDALSDEWDGSVIQGIRVSRGCLWGLCVGSTLREEWLVILGEPDSSLAFDTDKADAWRVVPGTADYYSCGSHQLRLYAGEDGVLACVELAE